MIKKFERLIELDVEHHDLCVEAIKIINNMTLEEVKASQEYEVSRRNNGLDESILFQISYIKSSLNDKDSKFGEILRNRIKKEDKQ